MIYFIILLSIIVVFLTTTITIDIKKFEIFNCKIKYNIYIKFYILKKIKIYSIKVNKKHIEKIINNIFKKKKKIKINNKFFCIEKMFLKVEYGWKNIFHNIYFYSIINALIPIFLNKTENSNILKYRIKTNFNQNFLKVQLKVKINIKILKLIINSVKTKDNH